jgi:hypothetical protein
VGLPAFVSSPGWVGLFAPGDAPGEIVSKLTAPAVEALAVPVVGYHFADFGTEVLPPGLIGEVQWSSRKRSSRDAYLQRLGARELVEARGRDVKASDNLFD